MVIKFVWKKLRNENKYRSSIEILVVLMRVFQLCFICTFYLFPAFQLHRQLGKNEKNVRNLYWVEAWGKNIWQVWGADLFKVRIKNL